eukprot:gene7839-10646_t
MKVRILIFIIACTTYGSVSLANLSTENHILSNSSSNSNNFIKRKCQSMFSIYQGKWIYNTNNTIIDPWQSCMILNSNEFYKESNLYCYDYNVKKNNEGWCPIGDKNTVTRHACESTSSKKQYLKAYFVPNDCSLSSIQNSILSISKHFDRDKKSEANDNTKPLILFIGDSLTLQLFSSLLCSLYHFDFLSLLDVRFVYDTFLRENLPCTMGCEMKSVQVKSGVTIKDLCRGCNRPSFTDLNTTIWKNIPEGTISIVIQDGAWYSQENGIDDSNFEFLKTMRLIAPFLQQIIKERRIEIFWVGLPPVKMHLEDSIFAHKRYDWQHYEEKSNIAKTELEKVGVQFIDQKILTQERKTIDHQISHDGLHWCNPGDYTIPSFINQIITHLIALKLNRKQSGKIK